MLLWGFILGLGETIAVPYTLPLMPHYLFVYGTLMRAFDNQYAKTLQQNANLIGTASLIGCLYDIGEYPGAVHDDRSRSTIYGELYHFSSPSLLMLLDEYEGFDPKSPDSSEYRRIKVQALCEDKCYESWFYHYNFNTDSLYRIKSGDYLSYIESQKPTDISP